MSTIETSIAVTALWTCAGCGVTRSKPEKRLPQGWKRRAEEIYCGDCWRKRYLLRAVTLPIASPVDAEWKELDEAMKVMWRQTTQASNWIMTELFARDVRRGDEEKIPPMARVYLYPELRKRWPDLPSQTVATLENTVQAKYRADRYDLIWSCKKSLPNFRYPVPFPIPAQGWSVEVEKDVPLVSVRIGDKRIRLRLHGGPRYRRQRQAVEQMASGEAETGEAAIYRAGDETLVKLVAWLPRKERSKDRAGILRVRTAKDCLMIAVNEKDDALWRYNGDHLARWIFKHYAVLQRLSEDQKYEQRPVPRFAARRRDYADKFGDRMGSACHEIASQLVNYAARRRFAQVVYDDSERGFVPQFPYFHLQSLLMEKCDERGIEFALASTDVMPESRGPLAKG